MEGILLFLVERFFHGTVHAAFATTSDENSECERDAISAVSTVRRQRDGLNAEVWRRSDWGGCRRVIGDYSER